jgi:type II secretory pathway predicted ATPase ExeA
VEHLRHFGLARDPFSNETVPPVFVESPQHAAAEQRLAHALAQRRSLTLLVGDAGTGKSLLLRRLLERLEEEVFDVALLVPVRGVASADWILSRLAQHLAVETPARERGELLGQVYEKLAIVREEGRHAVLLLDEAQALGPAVLAELRGLLNLEYEDRRLLSLVLVGPPELARAVAGEAALAGRVEARVHLRPLDANGAARYLAARVRAAQGDPSIFRKDALRVLAELSGGAPRALNTLADHALFEAQLDGKSTVEGMHVEAAARELGLGGGEPEETMIPVRGPAARPAARPAGRVAHGRNGDARERFEAEKPARRSAPARASAPLPRPEPAQLRALETAHEDLLGTSDDSFEPALDAFGSADDLSGDGLDVATSGPPKDEEEGEIEDLFVELVDEE